MSSRSAMALRRVAGDRPRTCRRATEREPTGCAVSTYSAMTASSTWRRRRSSAASDMIHSTSSQELHEEGVGEEKARLGESGPAALGDEKSALRPGREHSAEAGAIDGHALLHPLGGHALAHPEAEHEPLGHALARRQGLMGVHRREAARDHGRPAIDAFDVGVAHVAEVAAGPGPEAQVLLGAPVDLVVRGAVAGAGVVRDFVVLVARVCRELRHEPVLGGRGLLRGHEDWTFALLGRWGPSPTTSCGSQGGHAARVPEAALVEREGIGGAGIRLPAQHAFYRGLPGPEIGP